MVLSDMSLKKRLSTGEIVISPLGENAIQPGSIDIRLGNSFAVPDYEKIAKCGSCLSMADRLPYIHKILPNDGSDGFVVEPKTFVLATTKEYIKVPNNLSARVDGRSSIGRLGLFIQNAGWIDAGFEGEITLELFNALNIPILLTPGRRIGQLIFHTMEGPVENPYDGKYQGQRGATGSLIDLDSEFTSK